MKEHFLKWSQTHDRSESNFVEGDYRINVKKLSTDNLRINIEYFGSGTEALQLQLGEKQIILTVDENSFVRDFSLPLGPNNSIKTDIITWESWLDSYNSASSLKKRSISSQKLEYYNTDPHDTGLNLNWDKDKNVWSISQDPGLSSVRFGLDRLYYITNIFEGEMINYYYNLQEIVTIDVTEGNHIIEFSDDNSLRGIRIQKL